MTSEQRKQYSARLQTMSTEDKAQLFHESEQAAEASGGAFTSSDHAYSELFTNKQSGFYSEVTSNK